MSCARGVVRGRHLDRYVTNLPMIGIQMGDQLGDRVLLIFPGPTQAGWGLCEEAGYHQMEGKTPVTNFSSYTVTLIKFRGEDLVSCHLYGC
jgi:hypothetical protein